MEAGKYRGLSEDRKTWHKGFLIDWRRYSGDCEIMDLHHAYKVIPETVGQLVARIGDNEVYVGDELVNPKGRVHTVVIWDNLPALKYTDKGSVFYQPMTQGFLKNKKVIGNIHQQKF